jgi:hypothetical protein
MTPSHLDRYLSKRGQVIEFQLSHMGRATRVLFRDLQEIFVGLTAWIPRPQAGLCHPVLGLFLTSSVSLLRDTSHLGRNAGRLGVTQIYRSSGQKAIRNARLPNKHAWCRGVDPILNGRRQGNLLECVTLGLTAGSFLYIFSQVRSAEFHDILGCGAAQPNQRMEKGGPPHPRFYSAK